MKQILLLLLLAVPFLGNAQGFVQQTSSAGVLTGNRSVATTDGGYITVTKNVLQKPFSITAFRYNAAGALQWKTTVTNGVSTWVTDFPHVSQTADGGYMITILEVLGIDIIRLDQNGQYLWDKRYKRAQFSLPAITSIADVRSSGKGLMYLCGQYSTFDKLFGYVAAIDENSGNLNWFKTVLSFIDGQNYRGNDQDNFYGLSVTTDGGFIAAGITTQQRNLVAYAQYYTLYKFASDGTRNWSKAFAAQQPSDFASTVLADFESINAKTFILTGYNNYGQNCYFSINDTGSVLFARRMINAGDAFFTIGQAIYSAVSKRVMIYTPGRDSKQFVRLVLNASGDVQAAANTAFEADTYKFVSRFIRLRDGSVVATGYSNDATNNTTDNKLFNVRYAGNARSCNEVSTNAFSSAVIPVIALPARAQETSQSLSAFVRDSSLYNTITENFTFTTVCNSTVSSVSATTQSSLVNNKGEGVRAVLLGNPVQSIARVQLSSANNTIVTLAVTDQGGRTLQQVKTTVAGSAVVELPVSGLSKGSYFIRVSTAEKIQTILFVKQ